MTEQAATLSAGDRPAPTVQAVHRPEFWCRDLVSCLQATLGSVLLQHGNDPLEALGAGWEFLHLPGDVTSEEFYYPCRVPGDLGHSLAPHHPVRSRWHGAPSGDPLTGLATEVAAGRLPIAAVDNFHLPFRPAFHDVHAAHLVVVYGVDRGRGLVHVSDAMPPAFSGPIRAEDFLAAWGSANPADEQDVFFSDTRIAHRYLTVELGSPFPVLDAERLAAAMLANLDGFNSPATPADGGAAGARWAGLAGVERYVDSLAAAAAADEQAPLREAYTFGWGMQALCALHGELLRRQGARWDAPVLGEAARQVDAVAHAWTGLRVTAAHGWPAPREHAADLTRHGRRLHARYEIALAAVDRAAQGW